MRLSSQQGKLSALRKLKGYKVPQPIPLSQLAAEHGITYNRRNIQQRIAEIGIRSAKLGWPTSAGIRECIVCLPDDYDIAEYPHHSLGYRIMQLLPATRAELRRELNPSSSKVLDETLARLRRQGNIRRTKTGVYEGLSYYV